MLFTSIISHSSIVDLWVSTWSRDFRVRCRSETTISKVSLYYSIHGTYIGIMERGSYLADTFKEYQSSRIAASRSWCNLPLPIPL